MGDLSSLHNSLNQFMLYCCQVLIIVTAKLESDVPGNKTSHARTKTAATAPGLRGNQKGLRHRVDFTPSISDCGGGNAVIASDEEWEGDLASDGSMLLWTNADAIIVGGEGAGITGAQVDFFFIDDSTTDSNEYLVTLRYHIKFAVVAQTADLVFADTSYRAGVGFGVKKSGYCWYPSVCPSDFLWQDTLWAVDSGNVSQGDILGVAGEVIVSAAVEEGARRIYRKVVKEATEQAVKIVGKAAGVAVEIEMIAEVSG